MSQYNELIQQAQALMAQAEAMKKQEKAGAIAEIKAKMAEFGISVEELGKRAAAGSKPEKSPAKYRGPKGELWSGGPGRKPGWVKSLLDEGKSLDDFKI